MSAVIKGLHKKHSLLAAFLEAADRIDCRAFSRRPNGEVSEPVNLEVEEMISLALPQTEPINLTSPFVFRRANLVRASEISPPTSSTAKRAA